MILRMLWTNLKKKENAKTDEATKRKTLTWQNPVTPSTSKNLEITDQTQPKLEEKHEHALYKAWGLTTMKEFIGRLQRNTDNEANMTKMELMEANMNELVKVVEYAIEYNLNRIAKPLLHQTSQNNQTS